MEQKKYKMNRYERETIINFNDAEPTASICTSQGWLKRRLEKLSQSHPDDVIITRNDGYSLFATVPKKWACKIRPPRAVSDEQRQKAAERLKKYRDNKNSQSDNMDIDDADDDMDEDMDEDEDEDMDGEYEDSDGYEESDIESPDDNMSI